MKRKVGEFADRVDNFASPKKSSSNFKNAAGDAGASQSEITESEIKELEDSISTLSALNASEQRKAENLQLQANANAKLTAIAAMVKRVNDVKTKITNDYANSPHSLVKEKANGFIDLANSLLSRLASQKAIYEKALTDLQTALNSLNSNTAN